MIRHGREFALAADMSLAMGLLGAGGAAVTGITDWSDVDPPASRLGLIHGLLNVGVMGLFTTSFILRKKKLRTVPLLLVRRGQKIFAMAETCSHFSGPLSEGKLIGDSIVCPYHTSRFALDDGRVLDGPAVHPQPCLAVRVRSGQIEVQKPPAEG